MFNGPGKYDKECTAVREMTGGGVVLMVLDGKQGEGFSVQATLEQIVHLPHLLRTVADGIEAQQRAAGLGKGNL